MNETSSTEKSESSSVSRPGAIIQARARDIFDEMMQVSRAGTDRMFGWLMLVQWFAAVGAALWLSPEVWAGSQRAVHLHVYAAILLGGSLSIFPWLLIRKAPGTLMTRVTIGSAQMLWSGLLIHMTGGRIETHFHIFGSLAFLAFYRDVRVMIPATLVTGADHFLRGVFWPESIFGVANPEWWRFLEHTAWVVFCDVFLIMQCVRGTREVRAISLRQAETEHLGSEERRAKEALAEALAELEDAQETLVRTERLAAVGQLAAGVSHELRNPLAAIRNAHVFIGKKMERESTLPLREDPKVQQFRGIISRELDACSKIISDLLDFARARAPVVHPVSLKPLIDESIALVPAVEKVTFVNSVSQEIPSIEVDKDQVRQVFVNLIQNASEACGEGSEGVVEVQATVSERGWVQIRVSDNGEGIAEEKLKKIFQPLFSTKTKGTGLGLAIVQQMIERHSGEIFVESEVGVGTSFVVQFPPRMAESSASPALTKEDKS